MLLAPSFCLGFVAKFCISSTVPASLGPASTPLVLGLARVTGLLTIVLLMKKKKEGKKWAITTRVYGSSVGL